jgi:hypothetical protein
VTTTLADLRAQVRDRCDISALDPLFPDAVVDRHINLGQRKVMRAQPHGWWWATTEFTQGNGAADVEVFYPFSITFTDLIVDIGPVFVALQNTNYYQPVPRRTRSDAIRYAGGRRRAGDIPDCYSIVPNDVTQSGNRFTVGLAFEPALPANAVVRYIATMSMLDLVNGADIFGMPDHFAEAVIEHAAQSVRRQQRAGVASSRGRTARAIMQFDMMIAEEITKCLRLYYDRPYGGPGEMAIERPWP